MTAAVYRTTQPSLSIPHTQNTAPVLEFNCLYTHDIRRKQKRWQDGFLRFHTFNKRVMVYDIPRNFIGDTHWKEDAAVQDGDEVTLEKDGVLVQVAESVGRTETDLTELRRSKNKGSSEQGSSPAKGAQTPAVRRASGITQKAGTQLKHRSLNALLGTPKGPLGKAALPTKSPFEERHANVENEEWEDGRPPKRQRVEPGGGWNVTRTSKTPAAGKRKETPLWARTADAAKQKKRASVTAGQQKLGTKEVIELSDDGEDQEIGQNKFLPGFSSDALAPQSSPVKEKAGAKKALSKPPVRSSSPAFQTQKTGPKKTAAKKKTADTEIDATDRPANVEKPKAGSAAPPKRTDPQPLNEGAAMSAVPIDITLDAEEGGKSGHASEAGQPAQPASSKAGQTLRVTARSSKKTLLCQDQLTKKPTRTHSTNTENAIGSLLDAASQEDAPSKPKGKTQRQLLEERLAKMRTKSSSAGSDRHAGPVEGRTPTVEDVQNCPQPLKARSRPQSPPDDNAMTLAELDQMIMPSGGAPERSEPAPEPSDAVSRRPETAPVPAVAAARPSEAASPPMAPPPKQDRHLRKVVSDVTRPSPQKRAPGAPMRFTPSPSKRAQVSGAPAVKDHPARPTTAVPPKSRAKKPFQRAVSLNTTANGTSAVIFSKPFQTPKAPSPKAAEPQKAPDPWSREAFDLFTWRPPGWHEEKWCVGDVQTTVVAS